MSESIDQKEIVDEQSFKAFYGIGVNDEYIAQPIINEALYTTYREHVENRDILLEKIDSDLIVLKELILDGSLNLKSNYAELYALKSAVDISPKLELLLSKNSGLALKDPTLKCGAAILGGLLSGGIGGCKLGIKIGTLLGGPQNGLVGCVAGAIIGGTGTALLAGSQFCGND